MLLVEAALNPRRCQGIILNLSSCLIPLLTPGMVLLLVRRQLVLRCCCRQCCRKLLLRA
jgi:hypothetical protein